MWVTLLTILARMKVKHNIKREQKKNKQTPLGGKAKGVRTKREKKLRAQLFGLNIALTTIVAAFVVSVVVMLIVSAYSILTFGGITGLNIFQGDEEGLEETEENGTWEFTVDSELDDITTGGVYPKDPQLKQIAKVLEILDISCENVNSENGEDTILPSSILSVTIRETGGKLLNVLVSDPSLDVYNQLVYDTPICGKGTSCTWVKNGVSHFVGGHVENGVDKGDPATMAINEDTSYYNQFKTSDGHAVGYCQMEVIYVSSYLTRVYPIGDYESAEYDNSKDRYKLDSKLKFIRPNIAYIPDILMSTTSQVGGGLWRGANEVYNEMKSETWFSELSSEEQTYARSCMRQMNYVGGNVDKTNMRIMKNLIKLCYALKKDGHISDIRDFAEWGFTHYSGISTMLNTIYKNYKISRPSTTPFTTLVNKVMADTSLGSNTSLASSELKDSLSAASGGTETSFLKYGTGGYKWRHAIPGALGFESISHYIYKQMISDIENAEKEQGSSNSSSEIGVDGTNYIGYIGSGQFLNPTNSEYYCPDLKSIYFSQYYKGGTSLFGAVLPAYTTNIQNKKYMDKDYFNYGCPAYSMSMLLSNMTGVIIMPDAMPGTVSAGPEWKKGTHSISSSGLGFNTSLYVIDSLNKSIEEKGLGYQLRYVRLNTSQLASVESHIYEWFDRGAMLWVKVAKYGSAYSTGDHWVTLSGYDKDSKVGNNYDIRVLNSVTGTNLYTLIDQNRGQLISAEKLNENGLAYHLRNSSEYCVTIVWRDDISKTLPGLENYS